MTELLSHDKEFDKLNSKEVDPKINCIEFIEGQHDKLFVLSSNEKTIKLWKISSKHINVYENINNL